MVPLSVTELLECALFLALLLYALVGTIRIFRLRSRYRAPRGSRRGVLAMMVKEVYPDLRLQGEDKARRRRSAAGAQDPPWLPWLKQRKLTRLSFIRARDGNSWSGALSLRALHQIDSDVCAAFVGLLHRRLSAFADLNKPFQWLVNPDWTPKEIEDYDRQFAEHMIEQHLIPLGHKVDIPAENRRHLWRMVIDGKEFRIKEPLRFDYQRHFQACPGVGIVSAGEFYQVDEQLFTLDPSPKAQRLTSLTGTGLDGAIGSNQAFARDAGMVPIHPIQVASAGGADYQSPYITLGLSSLREIRLLMKRHTDLKTAAKNIGLDMAGSGVGGFAGAKAGATIGTALAPGLGSVVGAFVGGIGGAIAGRSVTNRIKLARAEDARKHYEEKVRQFQRRLEEVTNAARQVLEATIQQEQSALTQMGTRREKDLQATTQRLEERMRQAYLLPREAVRELLTSCSSEGQREEKALGEKLSKVSLWIRVFWPNEEAVRLSMLREHVRQRLLDLQHAREALLDPHSPLSGAETTEVALELVSAWGGHEEEIRRYCVQYKEAVEETILALSTLLPGGIAELAERRASALARIRERANALRRRTGEQLRSEVRSAKRAQNRFARELRKVGLVV